MFPQPPAYHQHDHLNIPLIWWLQGLLLQVSQVQPGLSGCHCVYRFLHCSLPSTCFLKGPEKGADFKLVQIFLIIRSLVTVYKFFTCQSQTKKPRLTLSTGERRYHLSSYFLDVTHFLGKSFKNKIKNKGLENPQ